MSFGNKDLGHIVSNVDQLSMRSFGIHLGVISQEMLNKSILDISLKITNSRLQLHLLGNSQLTLCMLNSFNPSGAEAWNSVTGCNTTFIEPMHHDKSRDVGSECLGGPAPQRNLTAHPEKFAHHTFLGQFQASYQFVSYIIMAVYAPNHQVLNVIIKHKNTSFFSWLKVCLPHWTAPGNSAHLPEFVSWLYPWDPIWMTCLVLRVKYFVISVFH